MNCGLHPKHSRRCSSLQLVRLCISPAAAQVTSAILARAVPTAIVSVESDFAAARRSMQSHPPDVLIVDPVLHRPESIWLVQHLKTEHPDAHVIVIASAPTPA